MLPESTTGSVVKGQDATFTVGARDPDQDSLSLTWAVTRECLDPKTPANWPPAVTSPSPSTFTVSKQDTEARFCVWAFATDRYGAVGANNRVFDPSNPANQPPSARIVLLQPLAATTYPLYTTFHLVGSGEDPDGDPITQYNWLPLQGPPGAEFGSCNDNSDVETNRCFTANTPGEYTAMLKVSSRSPFQSTADESPPYPTKFTVMEDAPPCIQLTDPDAAAMGVRRNTTDDAKTRTFTVKRVDDDGDKYPPDPGQPTVSFTWSFGLKGGTLTVANADYHELVSPPFDVLQESVVRVEVHDRRPDALKKLLACDKDFCEENQGSGCFQRVTWTVVWQ